MKAPALDRQQVGVDDFAEQRMAEPVGAGRLVDLEDVAGDRLANRFDQLAVRQLGHRCEKPLVRSRAGDRNGPEHALGGARQPRHTADEDVAKRPRDRTRPRVGLVRARPARDDLLGEERIPFGTGMDSLDDAAFGSPAEDGRELLPLLGQVERPEVHAFHRREAGDLGQPGQERVAALQIVGAERRDDHDPTLLEVPGEEREQVAACGIAPVEILQHDDEGSVAAQAVDQGEDQLEQASLVHRATGQRGGRGRDGRGRTALRRGQEASEAGCDGDEFGSDLAEEFGQLVGRQLPAETRSASRNGPYGTPSPPRSTQPPSRTRAPVWRAPAANSSTRRDLPRPASPPTRRMVGVPPSARRRATSSAASSDARPTRIGLDSVPAMRPMIFPLCLGGNSGSLEVDVSAPGSGRDQLPVPAASMIAARSVDRNSGAHGPALAMTNGDASIDSKSSGSAA